MLKFYNDFWKKNKDEVFHDFHFKWPLVKEIVSKEKNLTILDYGCGTGKFISEILKINPNFEIFGMDISDLAIKIARKNFPKGKFFAQDEVKKFAIQDKRIDLILAMDVIEHVFDVQKLTSEFNRILKPGGRIFVSTPYHGLIKNMAIALLGFDEAFSVTAAHIRFFSKNSLEALLRKNGFKILKYGTYGRFYPVPRGMYMLAEKI